jgi:selenoprotein W-related protein
VQLIESSGGTFDVRADGELIFSKKKMGRHAQAGEVVRLLHERSG